MGRLRHLSVRGEKTIRLVLICALAAGFGIAAVVLDSETWGYVASAIILVGILIGPLTARLLDRGEAS